MLVVEPGGSEVTRLPGPVENQQQEIPFDSPALAPVAPGPTTDDHAGRGPDGRPLPATGGPGTAILLLAAGAFARRRGR